MKKRYCIPPLYLIALLFLACTTSVPDNYTESEQLPKIYPDYVDVTIPKTSRLLPLRWTKRATA